MAGIQMKSVKKTYPGNVTVIPNLDLEIRDKEFVVLVGPSGCGKSTTLRMIAGLEEITEGDLFIGEQRMNDVAPKDRDIAMVFQNYALYPHMTVYKNMAFGLELRKFSKSEIDQRVREAARILDLEEYLDRKPKALSGGQRQRVALGRAMVRDPAVFLLDEPLSNLDAKLRTAMRAEIIKLHKRLATTFVYVTHDQIEAMTMGDRICVMKDGVIQQYDTPQFLFDHPANLFVAGFIGSPQMNLIPGKLLQKQGNWWFETDWLSFEIPEGVRARFDLDRVRPDQEVVLGVRPEALSLAQNQKPHVMGVCEFVERMGSEQYLYFAPKGQTLEKSLLARVPGEAQVDSDGEIPIDLDLQKLYLFDRETEASLFPEGQGAPIVNRSK